MNKEAVRCLLGKYIAKAALPCGRQQIVRQFLSAINLEVGLRFGLEAEQAVKNALIELAEAPAKFDDVHTLLTQICRTDVLEFSAEKDSATIRNFNCRYYFKKMIIDDLRVETQEGVI